MYDLIIRNGMVVAHALRPIRRTSVFKTGVLPRLQHSAVPKRKR